MSEKQRVKNAVRAALEHERRINLHRYPVHLDFADGVLTVEGEVENIAAKKLAMELAIAVPGVSGIVDRLHVAPATRMGDGAIRDAVRDALLQEPALQNCTIRVKSKDALETVRECMAEPYGIIDVSVADGGGAPRQLRAQSHPEADSRRAGRVGPRQPRRHQRDGGRAAAGRLG